jgi:hypothetical protein
MRIKMRKSGEFNGEKGAKTFGTLPGIVCGI